MIRNLAAIRAYRRPAHLMILRPAETPLDRMHTKLGGLPYLLENERWPICGGCHQPLTFMFQTRFSDIPPGTFRVGRFNLLTFYYCLDCLPHGSHEPGGYDLRLRKTSRADVLQAASFAMHDPDMPDPRECAIVFRTIDDLPPTEKVLSIIGASEEAVDEYERHMEVVRGGNVRASKVGGYPHWIQTAPKHRCACGKTMQYLAQIRSNPEYNILWRNNGVLYLLYCPEACSEESVAFIIQSR